MVVDPETDADLLKLLREGNDLETRRDAYARLYKRYMMHVIIVAHSRSPIDKDDIAQDLWEQIWRKPPDIAVGFDRWLSVAIRRMASSRAKQRAKTSALGTEPPSTATSQTREVARREALEVLKRARREGRVTDKQFRAIAASVTDDTTSDEIAVVHRVSPSGWRDRLRRGLAKLRRSTGQ